MTRKYGKMINMRREHDASFKVKVALITVKREKILDQIFSEYEVHAIQIHPWKKHLGMMPPDLFSDR